MKKSAKASPAKTAPTKSAKPSTKSSKTGKNGKAAKKGLPVYKVPSDFKPHFLLVQISTEKDGLLGTAIKATRYQGRFDREVEDKKKFDLGSYDPKTLLGIQARIAAVTYKATNDKKYSEVPKERADVKGSHRLPASTIFQVLMRIGKKSADNSVTCGVKQIWQVVSNPKTGRQGLKELEKTDPAYRMIRKSSRILPAAFKEVLMPPKRGRRQTEEE